MKKTLLLFFLLASCENITQPSQPTSAVWANATDTLQIGSLTLFNHIPASSFKQSGDSEYAITFDRNAPLYGAQIIDLVLRIMPDTLRGTLTYTSSLGTEIIDYNVSYWKIP